MIDWSIQRCVASVEGNSVDVSKEKQSVETFSHVRSQKCGWWGKVAVVGIHFEPCPGNWARSAWQSARQTTMDSPLGFVRGFWGGDLCGATLMIRRENGLSEGKRGAIYPGGRWYRGELHCASTAKSRKKVTNLSMLSASLVARESNGELTPWRRPFYSSTVSKSQGFHPLGKDWYYSRFRSWLSSKK